MPRTYLKFCLFVFLPIFALSIPCECQANKTQQNQALSDKNKQNCATDDELNGFIKKIETYLCGLKIMMSSFTQTKISKNNKTTNDSGVFYMKRGEESSYKICFDFDVSKNKIFVLKNTMIIKKESGQLNFCNLNSTPIAHLFCDNVKIAKHFTIIQTGTQKNGAVAFAILKPNFLKTATVSLFFKMYANKSIERIIGWNVKDNNSIVNVKFEEQTMKVNDPTAFEDKIFEEDLLQKKSRP
jgi:hypothetical protein